MFHILTFSLCRSFALPLSLSLCVSACICIFSLRGGFLPLPADCVPERQAILKQQEHFQLTVVYDETKIACERL